MEQFPSLPTIITSIVLSLISSYLFLKLQNYRTRRIQARILALDEEEKTIEQLAKGTAYLVRLGITTIWMFISLGFIAGGFLILPLLFSLPEIVLEYLYIIPAIAMVVGAVMPIYFVRLMIKSRDIKRAREAIQKQRDKLRTKISQ